MRAFIHQAGRATQLIALLILPSSLWVGSISHDETGSIAIFAGSMVIFFFGFLLSQYSKAR